MGPRADRVLSVTDLVATAVFAVEGSLAGAIAGLDLFGVLVVGFLTAVGGGITRDILLGDTPPAALRSKTYPIVIAASAGAAIVLFELPGRLSEDVLTVLDAGGLALFAATGAAKALEHGCHAWVAVLLAVITGAGGGVLRDVMLNRVPIVLTSHIYPSAAALGAVVVVGMERRHQRSAAFAAGITACFALRLLSVIFDRSLPHLSQ